MSKEFLTEKRLISIESVGAWIVVIMLAWNSYIGWKVSQVGEGLIFALGEVKNLQTMVANNKDSITALEKINSEEYSRLKNGR